MKKKENVVKENLKSCFNVVFSYTSIFVYPDSKRSQKVLHFYVNNSFLSAMLTPVRAKLHLDKFLEVAEVGWFHLFLLKYKYFANVDAHLLNSCHRYQATTAF